MVYIVPGSILGRSNWDINTIRGVLRPPRTGNILPWFYVIMKNTGNLVPSLFGNRLFCLETNLYTTIDYLDRYRGGG